MLGFEMKELSSEGSNVLAGVMGAIFPKEHKREV